MGRNMSPAELDPVEAAASPITPDPGLQTASREAMIARLVKAGLTPAEAARVVDAQLGISGPTPQSVFDEDNSPAGNDALRGRIADLRQREARQAGFEQSYGDATGAPVQPATVAPPAAVPEGRRPRTPDELRGMGYNPYTEPGPRMPDGKPLSRPAALQNLDAADAYNVRPELVPATDPSGVGQSARYAPSLRDRAWMARGFVPVFNEDGGVSYQLSPDTGVEGMPGASGRGGRRADLEAPILKADGTPYLDENGKPVPKWVVAEAQSPTGTLGMGEGSATVSVYAPSDATRQANNAYRAERRLYDQAAAAGMSPEQFYEKYKDQFGGLSAGGIRGDAGPRLAAQAGRQADADARMKAWRSQMMLAGSNPAKNAVNAYNQLNDPGTNDWQRLVIASRLGNNIQGVTPLGVQAQQQALLTQLGLRLANGQGFRDALPPGMQAAAEAKATAGLSDAEQIPLHKDKPGIHPSELQYADDYVARHYSSGGGLLGVSSDFTLAEQQATIDHLVNDMGYSPAKAQRVVDEIARRRHAGSWSKGTPVRGAPASTPPVPGPRGGQLPPAAPGIPEGDSYG